MIPGSPSPVATPSASPKPLLSGTALIVVCVLVIVVGLVLIVAFCWYFRCSRRFRKDSPQQAQMMPIYIGD